nr:SCO1664 family protein [Anaerolineae bacterium]
MAFEEILELLKSGDLDDPIGLIPWGSNHTFLVKIADKTRSGYAIYKPRAGERPLWDFQDGTLCQRETAAFEVSEAIGWRQVPPTVLRAGKLGIGSLQWFIPHNPEFTYFTLQGQFIDQFQQVALFDLVLNNADRKGSHCLLGAHGKIWLIDHGVCFHTQHKLRTVIWDFEGLAIPEKLCEDLVRLDKALAEESLLSRLESMLDAAEIGALRRRVERLLEQRGFPVSGPGRNYPWPPV